MLLYVPIYAALIYQYYGTGYRGLLKAFLWMLVAVFVAFQLPNLTLSLVLLVCMMIVITIAIVHDWFRVSKKATLVAIGSSVVACPVILIVFGRNMLYEYQIHRISSFIRNDPNECFMTRFIRGFVSSSKIIGSH